MIRKTDKEWVKVDMKNKETLPAEKQCVLIAILHKYSNAPWKYSHTESVYLNENWLATGTDHSYVTPDYWRPWPDLPFVEDFGEARSW